MNVNFEIAAEKTYKNEGGYVNNTNDIGGETNGGISKRSYPQVDIKNITKAEIFQIYKKDYWDKYGISNLNNQLLANQVFDFFINTRPSTAATCLQLAIQACGVFIDIDGVLGSETFAAANKLDPDYLLKAFRLERIRFYMNLAINNPSQKEFLLGWLRRSLT